jgi:hypothetical protein
LTDFVHALDRILHRYGPFLPPQRLPGNLRRLRRLAGNFVHRTGHVQSGLAGLLNFAGLALGRVSSSAEVWRAISVAAVTRVRRIVDAPDQHAQFLDGVVDRVGDGAGDVFADRRGNRQVAVGEVVEFVHQTQDGVLVVAIDQFRRLALAVGLKRQPMTLFQIDLRAPAGPGGESCQHHQHDQQDREPVHAARCFLITGARSSVASATRRSRGKSARRLLGKNQRLHVAENAGNGVLIALEQGIDLAELLARLGIVIAHRRRALPVHAAVRGRHWCPCPAGRPLGIDLVANAQRRGILGDTLGQHDQLAGRRDSREAPRLQLGIGQLLGQVQHLGILWSSIRQRWCPGRPGFSPGQSRSAHLCRVAQSAATASSLGPHRIGRGRHTDAADFAAQLHRSSNWAKAGANSLSWAKAVVLPCRASNDALARRWESMRISPAAAT